MKSLVGWCRKNWIQDFKSNSITHEVQHARIHTNEKDYLRYNIWDKIIKVRITIEELPPKKVRRTCPICKEEFK